VTCLTEGAFGWWIIEQAARLAAEAAEEGVPPEPQPEAEADDGPPAAASPKPQFEFLEGFLEKQGPGGRVGKKRFFRLDKNALIFSASAKDDAKVLGIVQLSGSSVKVDGGTIVIAIDGAGKEQTLGAESPEEAASWGRAIGVNITADAE
jgi:hypothetical protein